MIEQNIQVDISFAFYEGLYFEKTSDFISYFMK